MLGLLRAHVRDVRVLDAFAGVPREEFVPAEYRRAAYDDCALPIGAGQTISQPLMVAMQLEAAEIEPTDRVLEVGTGSGYQAALLSHLCADVVSVERVATLLSAARQRIDCLGIQHVRTKVAGSVLGAPAQAPYDAIVVAAGGPHVPRALLDQLAPGGRLVMPVGTRRQQHLVRARATSHGIALERLGPCAFVPLIGAEAWGEAAADVASVRD